MHSAVSRVRAAEWMELRNSREFVTAHQDSERYTLPVVSVVTAVMDRHLGAYCSPLVANVTDRKGNVW